MKKDKFMDYLNSNGIKVFNIHEAARIFGKSESYVSERLTAIPEIRRAKRGVYYVRDAEVSEIATKIVSPSYISLISAYAIHGATTQIPVEFQVIAPVQHRVMEVEGYRIRFFSFRRDRVFGYNKINGSLVALLEKAMIDSLYLNLYTDETMEVLKENAPNIDEKRFIDFGLRMKSKSTINRLGFLLDNAGMDTDALLEFRSQRYVRLGSGGESRNRKWRIMYAE